MKPYYIGSLLVLLSAVGFGLMPIFVLYAFQGGATLPTILFLRFGLAACFFFIYAFFRLKKWHLSKFQLFILFLLGGIFYTLQSSFYFTSVKYIPASLAALLLYTYPIFVAMLAFVVDKEKVTKSVTIAILFSFLGMALVLGTPQGSINHVGVILAVGAALVYSCYIVVGNRIISQVPTIITSAYIALFACISFSIFGLFTNSLHFHMDLRAWAATLATALISTIISIFAFFAGMKYLGPTKASIISMIEPLVTTSFSIALFQDHLTWIQFIGGFVVLSGAILVIVVREKNKSMEGKTAH